MAYPIPIAKLPPELIVAVFESLDTVTDVVNLSAISKTFSSIWKNHARGISKPVIQRSIPFYDQAQELASAIINDEKNLFRPNRYPRLAPMSQFLESGINKQKLIFYLAQTVETQLDLFGKDFPSSYCWPAYLGEGVEVLYPIKRGRIIYLYYRLWFLAMLPRLQALELLSAEDFDEERALMVFAYNFIVDNVNSKKQLMELRIKGPRRRYPYFEHWKTMLGPLYDYFASNYADSILHGELLSYWDRENIARFPLHNKFGINVPACQD